MSEEDNTTSNILDKVAHLQKLLTVSEHEQRVLQERLEDVMQVVADVNEKNNMLQQRVKELTLVKGGDDISKAELANQIKSAYKAETYPNEIIEKMQDETNVLQERITGLHLAIAQLGAEKFVAERRVVKIEKEHSVLKKTLEEVERGRLKTEEEAARLTEFRGQLDRCIENLESELDDSEKTIQVLISLTYRTGILKLTTDSKALQAQLADTEQSHASRLIEITTRHRQESEIEVERLRTAQIQAERTLEARERAHRQRVKGLEEQVTTLKDQLAQEIRRRQPYNRK